MIATALNAARAFGWLFMPSADPRDRPFMLKVLHLLAGKLRSRMIENEKGEAYLQRYVIYGWIPGDDNKSRPVNIYLHRFFRPDDDRAVHNHPWHWAVSFILTGGYSEQVRRLNRYDEPALFERRLDAPNVNVIKGDTFHRITELHGETWTLFIASKKHGRSWGFMDGERFVPWRQRLAELGIAEPQGAD